MPDFMDSRVSVTGRATDLRNFYQAHFVYRKQTDAVEFQLESIIPMPEEFRDCEYIRDETLALIALGGDLEPAYDPMCPTFDHLSAYFGPRFAAIRSRDELLNHLNEVSPEAVSAARKRMAVFRKTGYFDGYAWRIEQWGVKWDATSTIIVARRSDLFKFEFQTPWCFPEPVFRKLGLIYPSLRFDIAAVNMDLGIGLRGHILGADVSLKQMRTAHTDEDNGVASRFDHMHEMETSPHYPCMLLGRFLS